MTRFLPTGWSESTLADVAEFSAGRTPSRSEPAYWAQTADDGVPWVTIGDMRPHGVVSSTDEQISRKALDEVFGGSLVPRGTLLMSFKLTIGRVATLGVDACHNEAIIAIHPRDIDGDYLGFFLSQVDYTSYQDRAIKGNTLNRDKLNRVRILVPPLPEQRRIVALLQLAKDAIATESEWVTTARELKRSVLSQLLTRGLDDGPQVESEVGPVPSDWEVVPLGSLGRIGNGSTPLKSNAAYWNDGTIPWLTSAKVYDVSIKAADQFVTPLALKECHLPMVPAGSVVIAITGQGKTLGHAAVTDIDTCVSQHIAYIRLEGDVNPHYVRLFLESKYEELRSIAQGGGSTKGALTCGFLKTYALPLPPRAEQDEVASRLMSLEAGISHHERKLIVLSEIFHALLGDLMSGKLRTDHLQVPQRELASA